MEIILGIVVALVGIGLFMEVIESKFKRINWKGFFTVLIGGGVALAVVFSFTAEGVLVIVGGYFVLVVLALIFGRFKKEE